MGCKRFIFFVLIGIFIILSINFINGLNINVATCQQLQNLRNNVDDPSVNVYLTADIDCKNFDYGDGKGFKSISDGSRPFHDFMGNFYGQNHKIKNIRINRPDEIASLFGRIGNYDKNIVRYIQDFKIENISLNGLVSSSLGSVVGNYYISRVGSSGKIFGNSSGSE